MHLFREARTLQSIQYATFPSSRRPWQLTNVLHVVMLVISVTAMHIAAHPMPMGVSSVTLDAHARPRAMLADGQPVREGMTSFTSDDIPKDGYFLEFGSQFKIFGEAAFSSLYINSVGAVSFGSGFSQTKLESIKNDAIVFAPMFLQPEGKADIVAQWKFNDLELHNLEHKFIDSIPDPKFTIRSALAISWNQKLGNAFNITFATDGEKTYVLYQYIHINRIQDENGFAQAGIFAVKDRSILCPLEVPQSGQATMTDVTDFFVRIDWPLECDSFEISCTEPPGVESQLMAKRTGLFFKTLSIEEWIFYAYYMCNARRTKEDGSVTVSLICRDDPDYYVYSWSDTKVADVCSVEVSPIL